MSAQIGLSFFHDHRVELPLIGDGFGHHALEHLLPEPRISPHLVEVQALAALRQEPGAQAVERHDEPAGLHGDLQALAQRPVEADQERPPDAAEGLIEEVPGDLHLARSRRPVDTRAQGVHLEAGEEPHQPAAQAREDPLLAGHVGVNVRHDLEGLPDVDPHQPVRAAVDQVIEVDRPAALGSPELLPHVVERPLHLVRDALGPVGVVGDQPILGLLQRPVLLLDEQRLARPVHDHEVELAEHRLARPLPRQVHAVKHRVAVGQPGLEPAQRLDLVAIGASQVQPGEVRGNDTRHGLALAVCSGSVSRDRTARSVTVPVRAPGYREFDSTEPAASSRRNC